jgi:ribosomal RNA-processing protein 9
MDIFQTSKLVTGGEDRTTRSWKIQGGTHLLYTHHESSVDGVCAIDATTFASVGQDGRLAVGSSASKKPLAVVERAHGSSWLTAVACARLSDVVVSGGGDGALRFWQLRKAAESGKTAKRELVALATVPAEGHVNQIAVDKGGRLVFAAMGNEHKFGSWTRESGARKNGLLVVRVEHDGPVELY